MAYHVSFSPETKRIYAGTVNKKGTKWVNKSDVTEETFASVRELLLDLREAQEDRPDTIGYQWKMEDGHLLTLQIAITEPKEEGAET